MQKLYFKVYQSKNDTDGSYFVDTVDSCMENILDWLDSDYSGIPVLEPVYMTEEEFNELPDFKGY